MAADRAQHVAEVIAPALDRGAWVVCDRFVPSSLVYQGVARGLGVDAVAAATGGRPVVSSPTWSSCSTSTTPWPTRGAASSDRLEREGGDFHAAVRAAYRDLAGSARLGRSSTRTAVGRAQPRIAVWSDRRRRRPVSDPWATVVGQDRAVGVLQPRRAPTRARVPARGRQRIGCRGRRPRVRGRADRRPDDDRPPARAHPDVVEFEPVRTRIPWPRCATASSPRCIAARSKANARS